MYNKVGDTKKKKNKLKIKVFIAFLLFELIFTLISAPFFVFYGPFNNLKKIVVGASINSFKHQYIAKAFLSDEWIAQILKGEVVKANSNIQSQDLNGINVFSKDSSIECEKIEGMKFDGYMLIIHDPTRVRVGCSQKLGIQGEKTSQIAKEFNAIAAINGGGFTDKSINSKAIWTGTGAFPQGIVIIDGKVVYPSESILPDDKIVNDIAGLTYNGLLVVGRYNLNQLKEKNIRDAIVFGPPLIINGIAQSNINNQGTAPRTAIGQRADGAILLLVVDGRQLLKVGATIQDIQNIMLQENAVTAINLDGGASTTMYYEDQILNNPSDKFGERPIPTIFYVK